MPCSHLEIRCLNHYDFFRKYLCEDCGRVLMCACERELALTFLPHQTRYGAEYGTHHRYAVGGFAPKICLECRGQREQPHPRAAIWGHKGKVERYYWREIHRTYLELARSWMAEHNIVVKDVLDLASRFPGETKKFQKEAKRQWQQRHKNNPKYDMSEPTTAGFLSEVSVPNVIIKAGYVQVEKGNQKIGKWINKSGDLVSAEEIAVEHYRNQGFDVWLCERRLISTLVGTFLQPVIQDPSDPRVRTVMRGSTKQWSQTNHDTPLISFLLPEDFGTAEFYLRREREFSNAISELDAAGDLLARFDDLLEPSTLLRDYLWVNEGFAVELARAALRVLPVPAIVQGVDWAIRHFWQRQAGWPDLLLLRSAEFRFSEVKSPNDELSLEQMQWFRWATVDANLSCEICRVSAS